MEKTFLPTISNVVALGEFSAEATTVAESGASEGLGDGGGGGLRGGRSSQQQAQRAEREWQGGLAAVCQLLRYGLQPSLDSLSIKDKPGRGVLLSGPFPVLDVPAVTGHFSSWTFVPQPLAQLSTAFSQLMPARGTDVTLPPPPLPPHLLSLFEVDPLVSEQFCVILTATFSLVLVLGKDANDELHFQFSFMPEVVEQVWQLLRSRIAFAQPKQLEVLEPLVATFAPVAPDYRLVSQFSRHLLSALPPENLPHPPVERVVTDLEVNASASLVTATPRTAAAAAAGSPVQGAERRTSDTELLKAMAHEIRTPLTTIRLLTRSLLRRSDLDASMQQRLQQIDRECTQQINRFSLIFQAVELEATSQKVPRSPLTATSLTQLFRESVPQWQQTASRRNQALAVDLPPSLPMVVSDPNMLQQVLTGLIELFTQSASPGSHIDLQVIAAGHQLKLQFQSQVTVENSQPSRATPCTLSPLKSLGNLLLFQPETGGLSLNLNATKTLFQALGAKLIVRERPTQGATWTVFLPIETADYPIV